MSTSKLTFIITVVISIFNDAFTKMPKSEVFLLGIMGFTATIAYHLIFEGEQDGREE